MRQLINKIITKQKGESFTFDPQIPLSYIIRLLLEKSISLFYGLIRLRKINVYVHITSTIKCSSKIKCGKNFSIGPYCYVDVLSKSGLICGDNVSMGFHTHIELTGSLKLLGQGMKIGNNVGLGTHGHYGSGAGFVEIGDNTIIGNYVSIHPENHIYRNAQIPIRLQGVESKGGVKIGQNCWIGAKVTILDGTIIGNNCIVAAGAVVKGIFPDNVIIGGVPAKVIKQK